jgi:hypothetical protein
VGSVGVSANIVEASWRALVDSVEYKLARDGVAPIPGEQDGGSTSDRVNPRAILMMHR